ncbi:MAG TPA: oxygen-independent coproporphyrinogen III oxidase [Steroidobacteraceae bacterium]|nr:oxygen-independent coproporphyrinogen III oxidase [Steroidobacteraceae bacterium]
MRTADVEFDTGIMRRYDREGPRYTSYPTARQFHGRLPPDAYRHAAATSRGAVEGAPLSAYVHLPFCFSPCFYCGCNKVVTHQLGRVEEYVRHLLDEISRRSAYFDRERVVQQLHFGGGTPTFLPKKRLIEVIDRLDSVFQLTDDPSRDYSIEIDPRGTDRAMLQLLAALGFNRISLGVQDFDETVQRAVNRVQPASLVMSVHESARALGFRSINFDLIYGLPCQTPATFSQTLDRVVEMRPDRLAVYGYAHMPKLFKAQRQIRPEDLPDAPTRLGLLQLTIDKLCSAGYVYIGMDHFALPEDSLAIARENGTLHRSFQGYTTHADRDLVSFGVSAIGQIGDLYIQNHKSLAEYEKAVGRGELPSHQGTRMSTDDLIRRDVINAIMCHGFVDAAGVEDRHGIEFGSYFRKELDQLRALRADGLVDFTDDWTAGRRSAGRRIALTPVGRLLMRNVAMTFDAYLSADVRPPMSRVI